jgi:hypothetical protein
MWFYALCGVDGEIYVNNSLGLGSFYAVPPLSAQL